MDNDDDLNVSGLNAICNCDPERMPFLTRAVRRISRASARCARGGQSPDSHQSAAESGRGGNIPISGRKPPALVLHSRRARCFAVGAARDWNWLCDPAGKPYAHLLGRTGRRIFFFAAGSLLIVCGVLIEFHS